MSGKDWGDWTLPQMTWTLHNMSSFDSAKTLIAYDKPLLDALCSIVRGGIYDGISKKWAASVLWDVAFHPALRKADKQRRDTKGDMGEVFKPIQEALKLYDPATAKTMNSQHGGMRCCAPGAPSSRSCSAGDCALC